MKDTPKRVNTLPPEELNDNSAPAWTEVGLEVNGKVREVQLGLIVIVVEDDGEGWNVPDVIIACSFTEDGGKKS